MTSNASVKWFNNKKGFGFLTDCNTGEDIFVHYPLPLPLPCPFLQVLPLPLHLAVPLVVPVALHLALTF